MTRHVLRAVPVSTRGMSHDGTNPASPRFTPCRLRARAGARSGWATSVSPAWPRASFLPAPSSRRLACSVRRLRAGLAPPSWLPCWRCLCFCGCLRLRWRLRFCPGRSFLALQAPRLHLVANAGQRRCGDRGLLVVRNAVERFEKCLRHTFCPARSTRPGVVLDGHGRLVPFGLGAGTIRQPRSPSTLAMSP